MNSIIKRLSNVYQIEQRTDEWFIERKKILTATDIAGILGISRKHPEVIIKDKITPYNKNEERIENEYMRFGKTFEPYAIDIFKKLKKLNVHEIGLVIHPFHKILGASPDGLVENGFLLEIKCPKIRKIIYGHIPKEYWVQMQIQMECTDTENCYFMECQFNTIDDPTKFSDIYHKDLEDRSVFSGKIDNYYWELLDYQIIVVNRDRYWFNSIIDKIKEFTNDINYFRKHGMKRQLRSIVNDTPIPDNKRRRLYFRKYNEWTNVKSVYNFINDDPLLDWLDVYGDEKEKDKSLLMDFIKNQKRIFFNKIDEYLVEKYGEKKVKKVSDIYDNVSHDKFEITNQYLKENVPIIIGGFLKNNKHKLYGRIDIMIKSKYLHKLYPFVDIELDNKYYIVCIEYSNIQLLSDGERIGKNKKCEQIRAKYILQQKLLKNGNNTGILIAKKFNYTRQRTKYEINNIFEKAIPITCEEFDVNLLTKSLLWKYSLKKYGEKWDIERPETNNDNILNKYLRPNMKNRNDFPWGTTKKKLATSQKEITSLLYCSVKERNRAIDKGIYSYDDERLSIDILKPSYKSDLINKMLKQNKKKSGLISKFKINNKWKNYVNFFVDFETISNLFDDLSSFPISKNDEEIPKIFLIGITYVINNVVEHTYFCVDRITLAEEKRVIEYFLKFIKTKTKNYKKSYKIFHWSSAEVTFLNSALARHPSIDYKKLEFFDLLTEFKNQEIVAKGLLNNALKSVVKLFYENGWIKIKYDDSNCMSGVDAMIMAHNINKKAIENNKKITDYKIMDEIIQYNKVDCLSVYELFIFMTKL